MESTIPTLEVFQHATRNISDRTDILPEILTKGYAKVPEAMKHMDESELRERYKITDLDDRVRTALWREIQTALNTNSKIRMTNVYSGICTYGKFASMCNSLDKVAFLMMPAVSYETKTESLLNMAVSRYEELLTMSITTKKKVIVSMTKDERGKDKLEYELQDVIDPFRAKLLLDVIKNLEERVKGASVQRSVNIHESNKDVEGTYKDLTDMTLINEKLKMLEDKLAGGSGKVVEEIEYIDVGS
jgi:hypothetical protein